jgi:hypothetical protein
VNSRSEIELQWCLVSPHILFSIKTALKLSGHIEISSFLHATEQNKSIHPNFSSDNSEVFDELLYGRSMRVDQILCMDHFLCTTVPIPNVRFNVLGLVVERVCFLCDPSGW